MSDGCATGCAGKTSVGDEGYSRIELHAGDGRGRSEHLTHTRSAGRTLITDHDTVARLDLATVDRLDGVFLGVEAARGALIDHHLRCNGRTLDDGAMWCEVSIQYGETAFLEVWIIERTDDLRITIDAVLRRLADGLTENRHTVSVDQAMLVELVDHGIDSAGIHEILHVVVTRRCQMAEVRGTVGDLIDLMKIERNTCLMRDRHEVKCGIGGAAEGHIGGQAVLDRICRDDVTRTDVLLEDLHHLHAGHLRKTDTLGVDCRDGTVARKRHAQYLTEGVHGVRGEHTGAGTTGRTAGILDVEDTLLVHEAGLERTDCLKRGVQVTLMKRQHWPTGYEDGRQIQTAGSEKHARHDLIAVRDEDEGVEGVAARHTLDGVGDQLAG